jgi:hypothetical protein
MRTVVSSALGADDSRTSVRFASMMENSSSSDSSVASPAIATASIVGGTPDSASVRGDGRRSSSSARMASGGSVSFAISE